MSLNKLLLSGRVDEGLDLEIRSVSTSTTGGNLFRNSVTINGITDLVGAVTCENSLDVVGSTNLFGTLALNSKQVILDGIQTPAQQGLVFTNMNSTGSFDFHWEKYSNIMKLSGCVYGNLVSLVTSRSLSFVGNLPNGYTFSLPYGTTRFFAGGGGGCSVLGTVASRAQYTLGYAYPVTATTYRIIFNTGSGVDALDLAGQTVLSFSLTLDGVI